MRIAKRFTFEAAHVLPNHDGKCARLHGHSYVVEVVCEGSCNPENGAPDEGMVVDFSKVKDAWLELHELVDHRNLNDVLPAMYQPTTAEHIARWLLLELRRRLSLVVSVKVWETATSWAEATVEPA